jgi:hypothetical protein
VHSDNALPSSAHETNNTSHKQASFPCRNLLKQLLKRRVVGSK